MGKPNVVTVTANRPVLRHVTRALVSSGLQVHGCGFDRDTLTAELGKGFDLYVIDGDEHFLEADWLPREIARRGLEQKVIVFAAAEADHGKLLDLITDVGITHYVTRHGESAQAMVEEPELIVTAKKMLSGDHLGLDKYVSGWGLEFGRHEIQSNRDKIAAIEALDQFLTDILCNRRIMPNIAMGAEELLSNAIFNAPRDAEGNPKYADVDRRDPFTLEAAEDVTLTYACDGCYIGISVLDRFGSLTRDVALRYLKHCFRGTRETDSTKGRGAKLGLLMVYNAATQLVFNIEEGKHTEVIALYYVRGGARAFKEAGRSLNIFG